MPKLKTRKSLAKRIKVTKKKKFLHFKAGRRHLLSGKSRKNKRKLKRKGLVAKTIRQSLKYGLPYAF